MAARRKKRKGVGPPPAASPRRDAIAAGTTKVKATTGHSREPMPASPKGVLMRAGLVAVETMVSRLSEDHEKARALARIAGDARGARVASPETNILFVHFDSPCAEQRAEQLQARGIRASVMGGSALRFVTHRDVTAADCEAAGHALVEAAATD